MNELKMNSFLNPVLLSCLLSLFVFSDLAIAQRSLPPIRVERGAAQSAGVQKPQTGFVFDLFRTIVKDKTDENVMVSPYGVQWMLDLIRTGADGETKTEIEQVLGYTESVKWESLSDGTLTTAAAIWGRKGAPFLPSFLQAAHENFGSTIEQADFINNPGAAVKQINAWCSEKTKGKIPSILDRLDRDTRCVLVNAVHFKADWKTQFDKELTQNADFTLQDGTKTKTKIMTLTKDMRYGATNEELILSLPYKNSGYAMLLLLPKNATEFAKWESEMTTVKLSSLRATLEWKHVNLRMPRFTVTNNHELNKSLNRLGITAVFGKNADLSKIDGTKDLFVSRIQQKTHIAVEEEGTEAAAVTIAEAYDFIGHFEEAPRPIPFHADRPFLYAIVKGDTIFFLGRFVKPGM